MLELCRLNNAKFIFVSSYVYGVPNYLPIDEKHNVNAFNPYAHTKLIGEQICEGYHNDFSVPVIILRPFNIFGKGQNEQFLIPSILKQASTGRILLKDPRPKRDFLYIDDFLNVFLCLLEFSSENLEIFNIGSGRSYSIENIVSQVQLLYGSEIKVQFTGETRKNEVLETSADITKANSLLGWEPIYDLSDGIKEILKYNENPSSI
jgi:UDP-glucose 4-epimerase